MDENANNPTRIKGMNCLESINQGLLALAEQADKQGDFLLSSKLRAGITVNQARINQFKSNGDGRPS